MVGKLRRIFLGIPLQRDVSKHLAHQLSNFPAKIIPLQNWHLTLHFLGAINEERLLLVHQTLQSLVFGDPFEVTFDHLGAFPHPERAHSIWIGTKEGSNEIAHLVQIIKIALSPLDFPLDSRPYIPHLTVGRYSRGQNIAKAIKSHPFQKVTMKVDQFVLYESVLNEGSPKYRELYVYQLVPIPLKS